MQQGSGPTAAGSLVQAALPACLRQLHASAGGLQSAAAAAAEPEPVPHAVWEEGELSSAQLTPRQVVEMLDRYIVGQAAAKKAVANALRNRWRRHKVPSPLRVRAAGGRSCKGDVAGAVPAIAHMPGQRASSLPACAGLPCPTDCPAHPTPMPHPRTPCRTRAAAPLPAPHRRRRSTPRTCS